MKKGQNRKEEPIEVTGCLADDIDLTISAKPDAWEKLDKYISSLKGNKSFKEDMEYFFFIPVRRGSNLHYKVRNSDQSLERQICLS